jgi:hypothetical protein
MRLYGFLAALLFLVSGCGYTLQNSHNPLADREGVRRVYVSPLVNNTYKGGVENLVFNALVRVLAAHHRITLVQNPEDADAILNGTVAEAFSAASAATSAANLNPVGLLNRGDVIVASEYTAVLTCRFDLLRRGAIPPGKKATLWTSTFSRSKPFPAANQVGSLGTTSALINDSEFDRALSDLASSMMGDVHESMLAMF